MQARSWRVLLPAGTDATVADEHRVRTAVRERLASVPFDVWLNFELVPPGAIEQ